jgi:hypothetical protein
VANPPWLERLRAELGKHSLPPAYRERLEQELSDHWQDLREEIMLTETEQERRIGEAGQLALLAASAYRRGLLERRPLLAFAAFVLLPLPVLALPWLGVLCACAGVLELLEKVGGKDPTALNATTIHSILAGVVILSCPLAAAGFAWLARRTRSSRRWALASCLVIMAAAGLTFSEVRLSGIPGQSSLLLGVGLGHYNSWRILQLCLALPLCLLGLRWPCGIPGGAVGQNSARQAG